MRATSTSALALAARLRGQTDAELADLLTDRQVQDRRIRDFFDLAEALLDRGAVQHALSRLDRPTLAVVATIALAPSPRNESELERALPHVDGVAAAAERARALALVERESGRFAAYDTVAEQLESWPSIGLPSLRELVETPPPAALEPVSDADTRFLDRAAREHAFTTTTAISELVAELARQPARELAKGGIALPDSKRLAQVSGIELEQVPPLREIAERAGLILRQDHLWKAAAASDDWQLRPAAERWGVLADSWYDRLPTDIREVLAARAHAVWGEGLEHYLAWFFPAGGDWMRARVVEVLRDAELLGLTAAGASSTAGRMLLSDGLDAAVDTVHEAFPPEVEQVYIQNDLTLVAPGPLAPAADARVRAVADIENRALASSYRVSAASLTRAFASGETAESVRAALSALSLTGIPQPLDYLITETAERYGTLRVSTASIGPARTAVRSADPDQLAAIAVDQNLAHLGLRRDGERLTSPLEPDAVFWSLTDARYLPAMEDAAGALVPVERMRTRVTAAAPAGTDIVPLLVERLRLGGEAAPEEDGAAWLARQLEIAVRARAAVRVTVRLPDGSTPTYTLEPAALAGGRLRARDRASDIERTLPLSSITAVEPAAGA